MKKMKKSLLTLLTAILIGSSFTSCIENTVPDEVSAIYAGQASYLEAQAALQLAMAMEAEAKALYQEGLAAVQQALAEVELARAEQQRIANELLDAQNTNTIATLEAQLELQLATIANSLAIQLLAAENNRIAAERAAMVWEAQQIALQARIVAANEQAITTAYNNYYSSINALNLLILAENAALQAVIVQEIAVNRAATFTDASTLASLERAIIAAQDAIALREGWIADNEALLAPGSTNAEINAQKELNIARIAEIDTEINTIALQMANLLKDKDIAEEVRDASGFNEVNDIFLALQAEYAGVINGADVMVNDANGVPQPVFMPGLEALRVAITNAEAAVVAQNTTITSLTEAVTNYDTALQTLVDAVPTAEGIVTTRKATLASAIVAEAKTKNDSTAAANNVTTQKNLIAALKITKDVANDTLEFYSNALVMAISMQGDSIPFTTAVTTANTNLNSAQTAYDNAKTIFDDKPAGSTVKDGGIDDEIGNHDDTSANTYRLITAVFADGRAVLGTENILELPVGGMVSPSTWDNFIAPDQGMYYNIETDDGDPVSNVDALNNAADALDTAKLAVTVANDALEAYRLSNDISEEEAKYEAAAEDFATVEARLKTAEEALPGLEGLETAANNAHAAAKAATANARTAVTTAETAVTTAKNALATFRATTKTQREDALKLAQADLVYLIAAVGDANLALETAEAEEVRLSALIDAGVVITEEQQAAQDAFLAAEDAYFTAVDARNLLGSEKTNLETMNGTLNALLNTGANGDTNSEVLQDQIDLWISEIADSGVTIAFNQDQIDNFIGAEAAQTAILENLQRVYADAILAVEQQQILSDRFKAVLDALI